MDKIIVKSPSKINLGLNVIRKRNDGYHDIETIFLPLLLCDTITYAKSNEPELKTNSDLLNNSSGNLVLKAIELLGRSTKSELKLKVFVNKVIPIGGGLGGGSSNAAITLKTVNRIYNLGLSNDDLLELALKLGSDVPFFLNPVTSFAESRGEILQPLKFEIPYPILIVNPGIKIDTSWAFSKIHPSKPKKSLKNLIANDSVDLSELPEIINNDFEKIVFEEFPVLSVIKESLYSFGAQFASMSGTGSTVYGIFSNLQKAHWAEEYFKQKYFTFLNNPFTIGSIT